MRSRRPDAPDPGAARPGTPDASATTLSVMGEDAWFQLISASVDGELSPEEYELVERHLERSPRAREVHQELAAMRRRTLIQPIESMPDLTGQIVARTRLDAALPEAPPRSGERRRWLPWAGIAAAAAASMVMVVALVAVRPWSSPAGESSSKPATITASDASFDHTDVQVTSGSAITWINVGDTTHELVQQLPDASVSGLLHPNEDRSVTFEEPGVYEFYCRIHDNMTGTVTVD